MVVAPFMSTAPAGPVERIFAVIRARGGRVTGTRRATIEVLADAERHHLTAEQVAEGVRERHPDVAESTIYRILSALEDVGAVTHVHLGHGASTYHLADDDHRHLLCRSCGAVTEIPDRDLADFKRLLDSVYGFTLAAEHFAITGDCRTCQLATSVPRSAPGADRAPVSGLNPARS